MVGDEMKVKVLILCTISLAVSAAHAQTSVTLYGTIDNGVQYETGGPKGNLFSAASGDYAESRFGLLGKEDLGAGTRAIFQLEAGLNTYTGQTQNGSFFGRNATVGLANDNYGTLKLGDMGALEMSVYGYYVDPERYQRYALATLVRGRNWAQAGNAIEYTSPTLGGLSFKGQYDLTNSPKWNSGNSGPNQLGSLNQGRSNGLMATYDRGNVYWEAIYDEIRDDKGNFSNVYMASRSLLTGGTYTIGPFKIYAGYQHLSAPDASEYGYFTYPGTIATTLPAGTSLPTAVDQEWLGAVWSATPAFNLTAAVYHANANHGNGNATLYTLTGSYALSKRTLLVSEVGYIHNSSTSNIGLGNGYGDAYGANSNNDPASGPANTNNSPNYGHGQFGAFVSVYTSF
jgi:predicted porin